jgi:hypothetical protein
MAVPFNLEPGRYAGSDVLWFNRGHKILNPWPRDPGPGWHGYCDNRVDRILVSDHGTVLINILQPDPCFENDSETDERIRICRKDGRLPEYSIEHGHRIRSWGDNSLMGQLLSCRTDGNEIEMLVEDCGKFYLRSGAQPSVMTPKEVSRMEPRNWWLPYV